MQEKYLAPIQARIDDGDCPLGLRKQYKLQLERIKARTPSHEIALFQSIGMWLGKRDDFRTPPSSTHPHRQSLILRRNMQLSGLCCTIHSPAVPLCASMIYHSSRANAQSCLQHIKSSNPLEHPVIDPHYFEEEYGRVFSHDLIEDPSFALAAQTYDLLRRQSSSLGVLHSKNPSRPFLKVCIWLSW